MSFQNWLKAPVHNYVCDPQQYKGPEKWPAPSGVNRVRHGLSFLPPCTYAQNYIAVTDLIVSHFQLCIFKVNRTLSMEQRIIITQTTTHVVPLS
jgi:hypothetical protein